MDDGNVSTYFTSKNENNIYDYNYDDKYQDKHHEKNHDRNYDKNQENTSTKIKTEIELFEEYSSKTMLPQPMTICFSNINLAFESNCYLCGSFDDQKLLITCCICFESFHSFCISNSDLLSSNIENIKKYNWKCQNCKYCEQCSMNKDDDLLVYCDSCDRAMHIYCLKNPLKVVPESGWKCSFCFKYVVIILMSILFNICVYCYC